MSLDDGQRRGVKPENLVFVPSVAPPPLPVEPPLHDFAPGMRVIRPVAFCSDFDQPSLSHVRLRVSSGTDEAVRDTRALTCVLALPHSSEGAL